MSFSFKLYVIFFGLLVVPCLGEWGFHTDKWHIHVVNNLSGNRNLFAHCKSADDDIGPKNLVPGAEFAWTFKVNYFGTTLFWCYTRTDHEHAAFDVFWPESDHIWLQYRCKWKNCIWIAKDDGFYIRNIPEDRDELIHKWEKGF